MLLLQRLRLLLLLLLPLLPVLVQLLDERVEFRRLLRSQDSPYAVASLLPHLIQLRIPLGVPLRVQGTILGSPLRVPLRIDFVKLRALIRDDCIELLGDRKSVV